jgi:hypothetical protein
LDAKATIHIWLAGLRVENLIELEVPPQVLVLRMIVNTDDPLLEVGLHPRTIVPRPPLMWHERAHTYSNFDSLLLLMSTSSVLLHFLLI